MKPSQMGSNQLTMRKKKTFFGKKNIKEKIMRRRGSSKVTVRR